jgi:hypothetical protein
MKRWLRKMQTVQALQCQKNVAFAYITTYVVCNTPAMPMIVRGYAHFGRFFYARRSGA